MRCDHIIGIQPMPYARKDTVPWMRGHYYHLYNRGMSKTAIFREEDNYHYVLLKARRYCQDFQLSMIAYCLMPNHYHFLVRQDGLQRAGKLPQLIFNGYSKAYNKRYDHSGTLFERRYQSKHIKQDSHLLHLCRYIHANPVVDGVVERPEDWQYSNYREWVGLRKGKLVDWEFVRENFHSAASYREFVLEYIQAAVLKYSESR